MKTLDKLLGSLHSDKNRLTFLKSVYTLGNVEVADRILDLKPTDLILEGEVNYAQEHGEDGRFNSLARRFIDHYIEEGYGSILVDRIIKWGNVDVADYAMAKLEARGGEGSLESAGRVAQSFGQIERGRELLEEVLEIQLKKEDGYLPSPAGTCVELGRFDEAIDLFMKSGYQGFYRALDVAKEHVSERLNEVAQRGFDEYSLAFNTQETFVECAEILGKLDNAKRRLSKEAKELKSDKSPRFYQGLASALVKLGLNEDAKIVVEKVANQKSIRGDSHRELVRLYETIGEQAPIRDILLAKIDEGLNEDWHPSSYLPDIEKGFELFGDNAFLERRIQLFEKEEKYDEASKLAREIGNSELAKSYRTMHQLVSAMPKD